MSQTKVSPYDLFHLKDRAIISYVEWTKWETESRKKQVDKVSNLRISGPSQDLLDQSLHFTRSSSWFLCTWKFDKCFQRTLWETRLINERLFIWLISSIAPPPVRKCQWEVNKKQKVLPDISAKVEVPAWCWLRFTMAERMPSFTNTGVGRKVTPCVWL